MRGWLNGKYSRMNVPGQGYQRMEVRNFNREEERIPKGVT